EDARLRRRGPAAGSKSQCTELYVSVQCMKPQCLDLLLCPHCRSDLTMAQAGLFCSSCHRRFDEVGGIPLLVSESQSQRFHWGRLLGAFQAETHQATLALSQSLLQPRLLHKTRRRLELVRAALTSQVERIVQLFDDAGITPMAQAGDLANPIQSVPDSLLSYFTLIHRDYGWAPESNEAAQSVED